jgi:sugar (pentulose or hexulose) kinase
LPLNPAIAIFDIGKTNKKVFLFDQQYNIIFEKSENFAETKDEDGDPCEDLPLLTEWIKKSLFEISNMKEISLQAVNFSAYGASFVHIDREGRPVAPLYNYLKPYPKKLKQQFYQKYGGELLFSMQTASPVLGNLNSGLQLYLLKNHKPEIFKATHYSLHLPQYLSFLVTGRRYSDITSIGCHTGLWNFTQNHYHEWLFQETINAKLAPIFPSDQLMRTDYNKKPVLCGVGLHDSSAALIPYLSNFSEPFVLISTGTWCISLNPFNQSGLTAEELQQDCLCYMEYRGKPVKASRLFAGYEHEQQVKRLANHFNVSTEFYKTIPFDADIILGLQKKASDKNDEKKMMQQSAFVNRDLSTFKNYNEAYHQLTADLINQQVASTNLVLKNSQVKKIFLDGGFSRNPIYMNLLSLAYPGKEVYAASIAQASALGAALAGHHYWNKQEIASSLIRLKHFTAELESHS